MLTILLTSQDIFLLVEIKVVAEEEERVEALIFVHVSLQVLVRLILLEVFQLEVKMEVVEAFLQNSLVRMEIA